MLQDPQVVLFLDHSKTEVTHKAFEEKEGIMSSKGTWGCGHNGVQDSDIQDMSSWVKSLDAFVWVMPSGYM